MTFEDFIKKILGSWKGEYLLWINPNDPPLRCDTTAQGRLTVMGRSLLLEYSWEYEGKMQEGILMVSYHSSKKRIEISWQDSWHQYPLFMISEGALLDDGSISAKGSYEVSEGPKWEWRTKIHPKSGDIFIFEMYNITPQGEEALAVQVEYNRN